MGAIAGCNARARQDLFVQFDYMCGAFLADGVTCDFDPAESIPLT